jgi:hypothetical protein
MMGQYKPKRGKRRRLRSDAWPVPAEGPVYRTKRWSLPPCTALPPRRAPRRRENAWSQAFEGRWARSMLMIRRRQRVLTWSS